MRNYDLVKRFFEGGTTGHGSNLYINGDYLIEYNTCLAQRTGTGYIINGTKYSRTTSKIQSWINYHCKNVVTTLHGLDFGVHNLADLLIDNKELYN